MNKKDFLEILQRPRPLLADGAMGTLLHERGIGFENCFDELNLTDPGMVGGIHRDYIDAGSQIILTNTFGANRFKLDRHGLEGKLEEINSAGVKAARKAVKASLKEVLIGGDVGPLGIRLAPFGRVQPEEARAAYQEQIACCWQPALTCWSLKPSPTCTRSAKPSLPRAPCKPISRLSPP